MVKISSIFVAFLENMNFTLFLLGALGGVKEMQCILINFLHATKTAE